MTEQNYQLYSFYDNIDYETKPYGVNFAKEHMAIPFIVCGGYLTFIYQFSNYMKAKEPFKLKRPLIYWNASLCIFSFIGA